MQQVPKQSGSSGGPERFILVLALLAPLALMLFAAAQIGSINLSMPSTLVYADTGSQLTTSHPAPRDPAPPPTLAPYPTATPVPPTPTAAPAGAPPVASPTSSSSRTYTVQKGDELRHIAAQYGVSIWKIIDSNDIPNPDSLRVGQVLQIPSD